MKIKKIIITSLCLLTLFSYSQKKNNTKNNSTSKNIVTVKKKIISSTIQLSKEAKEIYDMYLNGMFLKRKFYGGYKNELIYNGYSYEIENAIYNDIDVIFLRKYNDYNTNPNNDYTSVCAFYRKDLTPLFNFGKYRSAQNMFKISNENRYVVEVTSFTDNKYGLYDLTYRKEIVQCKYGYITHVEEITEGENVSKGDYSIFPFKSNNNFKLQEKSTSSNYLTFNCKTNSFEGDGYSSSSNNANNNPCANSNIPPIYEDYGWKNNNKSISFRKDNGSLDFIKITYNGEYYGGTKWFKTESEAIRAEYMYQKYGCH